MTFHEVPPNVFTGVIAQLQQNSRVSPLSRFAYSIEGRGISATVEYSAMLQQVNVTLHKNPFGEEIVRREIQAAIEKAGG